MSGSAIGTCSLGTITYSDYLDPPTNSKAQTLTIANAVVPPRPSGTVDPNCSIRVPVFTGSVSRDSNASNVVRGADATAFDGAGKVSVSNDFSATLRVRAPIDPLQTSKSFSPSLVVGGAKTQLTINVKNNTSNPAIALSGVSLTDNLPAGMSADGAPTFGSDCGGPATTTGAGATVVNMTGGSIAAGKTCKVTVDVITPSTTEELTNTIQPGQVTAGGGYANAVSAEAKQSVRSEIKITKAFGNNGGTSQWHTVDAPTPANLHGETFNTATPATAEIGQPVPVRVYFSNPLSVPLTGGQLVDNLPGNTVSVAGAITGSCSNLSSIVPIAGGLTQINIVGFGVPAASSTGAPGSCYVQFYVKTTDTMNPATNALSVATVGGHVTFQGFTPESALFPQQATSAQLITTAPPGPGPYDGKVNVQKGFITGSTNKIYSGTAQKDAARINKGEKIWMRIGVTNTKYDVDYEDGRIVDHLPPGLKVSLPEQKLVMQQPPAPSGSGAVIANAGCPVPGDISVSGKDITYSGWTLLNAAGPNNASPRNNGCVAYILLESDSDVGSDSINTILAN